MKNKLLILILSIILISCASKTTDQTSETIFEPKDPMEKFYCIKDDFTEMKFTHFNNQNSYPFTIYMGENNETKWLRMTFFYSGNEWIFFKTATLKNKNGDFLKFNIPVFDKKEKITYSGVSEFIDLPLSQEDAENLRTFLNEGEITVRLSGEKYKDSKIKEDAITAYCELIDLVYPE